MRSPLVPAPLLALLLLLGVPRGTAAEGDLEPTREDLARSYLAFERAFAAASPTGDPLREVNRDFDRATLAFFAGQRATALRNLDAGTRRLTPEARRAPAVRDALTARTTPAVVLDAATEGPLVRVASLYDTEVPGPAPTRLLVRLVDPKGSVRFEHAFEVPPGPAVKADASFRIPREALPAAPATCTLEVSAAGGPPRTLGRLVRAAVSFDARREANATRLEAFVPPAGLAQAVTACRARNGLLTDAPSPSRSASFLADLPTLADSVEAEVAALLEGRDPYRRRAGTWWRTVAVDGKEIPVAVHAPPRATADEPVPVVVALHGAGGDENMFLEAYGAGTLRTLAEQRGFLLLSVATMPLLASPGLVHGVVAALAEQYPIDRKRVHVLGHSLGAMAASRLAANGKGAIASACLLAAGTVRGLGPGSCPTLVVAGEIDPLAKGSGVAAEVEACRARGAPVEFRMMEGYGHTLFVGAVLPDAVAWMLSR